MSDITNFLGANPVTPDFSDVMRAQNRMHEATRRMHARQEKMASAAEAALNAANDAVGAIVDEIADFESKLEKTQEVGLYVVGGPSGTTFFPESLFAQGADKVIFRGVDQDGRPFTLIQHVSQLNFALRTVPVAPDSEPRRIGFHHPEDE